MYHAGRVQAIVRSLVTEARRFILEGRNALYRRSLNPLVEGSNPSTGPHDLQRDSTLTNTVSMAATSRGSPSGSPSGSRVRLVRHAGAHVTIAHVRIS
jgi:hypothetical protein